MAPCQTEHWLRFKETVRELLLSCDFQGLVELSLASTVITSQFLCNGPLDRCLDLSKLNLCRTLVSNKGVACLKSESLSLINLDGTHVKPSIVEIVHSQCPNLTRTMTRKTESQLTGTAC